MDDFEKIFTQLELKATDVSRIIGKSVVWLTIRCRNKKGNVRSNYYFYSNQLLINQ